MRKLAAWVCGRPVACEACADWTGFAAVVVVGVVALFVVAVAFSLATAS